jgi:hypothetical protein
MGCARFQAPNAALAQQAAEAALVARAGGEPRWSLGLLRPLTPNAPGTRLYVVTFAAWEAGAERFNRRDVHEREVWASDATSARRCACEQVQTLPGYRAAWRVRQVARATTVPRASRARSAGDPVRATAARRPTHRGAS